MASICTISVRDCPTVPFVLFVFPLVSLVCVQTVSSTRCALVCCLWREVQREVCACVYMCVCTYVQCVHRFVFHTCSHFRCTVTVKHGLNYTRAPTQTQTHARTHAHRHMHAYTHRLTHRHRHTHACTDSHTDSHTDTDTHTHARTHTQTHTQTQTHARTQTHTHMHGLTHTRTHTQRSLYAYCTLSALPLRNPDCPPV